MTYANVNGQNLYYEIHGSGRPLVVLPGTTHVGLIRRTELVLPIVETFLP